MRSYQIDKIYIEFLKNLNRKMFDQHFI